MKWHKTGTGRFATYRLDLEDMKVEIFPPAKGGKQWVAYIDDRIHCNTLQSFKATEAAVEKKLRALHQGLARVLDVHTS